MKTEKVTNYGFSMDVINFKIEILKDDGVYRHIRCSDGTMNMRYDIITYPGHLVISGDMGCSVFSRVYDMFTFFNNKVEDGINPNYWGEKLVSIGDGTEFSHDAVENCINKRLDDICSNMEDYWNELNDYDKEQNEDIEVFENEFRDEVKEYFRECVDESSFMSSIHNFESKIIENLSFCDDYEWIDCSDYDFRYLWQCHAIVWCIEQYNMTKE